MMEKQQILSIIYLECINEEDKPTEWHDWVQYHLNGDVASVVGEFEWPGVSKVERQELND